KKNFQRARLEEVITASPDRVDPPCPYYYKCGGCSYQHTSYSRQLEFKRQVVKESLKRIGGIDIEVNPVVGMEDPWRYRNKVEWHTGKESGQPTMGYYVNDSRVLVGIDSCLLISQAMQDYSHYIKEHLEELRIPENCEVIVRQSSSNQEMMIIFRGTGASGIDFAKMLNYQEVAAIYSIDQGVTRFHYGEQRLAEKLFNLEVEVSPLVFFQVNHTQTEKMLEIIKDYAQLQASDCVLDAYCGMGSIALALAGNARRIVGVESFKAAKKDAKRNAFNNSILNCKFIKGACEEIIPGLEEEFDVVILDPPRAGCKPELIQAVIEKSPRCIIYVSCNPSTLARDLAIFKDAGYTVDQVQPIDMFPQTSHVETVVRIYRG
ncbi:MAG: 23S rRNA (uracil(1939)-C(5))-methyltransferase RlmD, partial [Oscillospiraceae bacterium]